MSINRMKSERKRIACIMPPFFRLIESKNNRLTPAMHYVAEILHRRGHEVIYYNGDYAEDSFPYADRVSINLNNWLFEERYKKGHESFDAIIGILKDFSPDYVIISAGDIIIPTVEVGSAQSCSCLARKIKEEIDPDISCIGYGHLLRFAKADDLKYLDMIICGEAEDVIIPIVEENAKEQVPIKWFRKMDDLPILTDDYILNPVKPEDWDYIMSMRGCPNRCVFCFQPFLRGYEIGCMSPDRFVRELRYRIEKIGTTGFYFSDTIFLPTKGERTEDMIRRLKNLKKDYPLFHWWAEARVDLLKNKSTLFDFKESGCHHLKFGVEMGNQQMLNKMKKGIDLGEVKTIFKLAREAEIKRTAYVLLGCPGFEDKEYQEMWHFFKELEADHYVININIPYRGTELYDMVKDDLHHYNIYSEGEEGYTHTSLIMKKFWNISDETVQMFFNLEGKKDDSHFRLYQRKIVDYYHYTETGKIRYLETGKSNNPVINEIGYLLNTK